MSVCVCVSNPSKIVVLPEGKQKAPKPDTQHFGHANTKLLTPDSGEHMEQTDKNIAPGGIHNRRHARTLSAADLHKGPKAFSSLVKFTKRLHLQGLPENQKSPVKSDEPCKIAPCQKLMSLMSRLPSPVSLKTRASNKHPFRKGPTTCQAYVKPFCGPCHVPSSLWS